MAARQCEDVETHISVCNDLIDLNLQEVYRNIYINWLRHQVVKTSSRIINIFLFS